MCLPLYEGKMVQAFDHRAASVVVNPENLNRPAQPRQAARSKSTRNPGFLPEPSVSGLVKGNAFEWQLGVGQYLRGVSRTITATTNVRTMIASPLVPQVGMLGNTLPLLLPDTVDSLDTYPENAWLCVLANA